MKIKDGKALSDCHACHLDWQSESVTLMVGGSRVEDKMIEEVRLCYGEGRYRVSILAIVTTDGLSITLTGGEKPHVGGMAMSVPRQSLDGHATCDTWITPVPGHKDAEVAHTVAKLLCLETGQTTVVVAGIHVDQPDQQEITKLVDNSITAAQILADKVKGILKIERT